MDWILVVAFAGGIIVGGFIKVAWAYRRGYNRGCIRYVYTIDNRQPVNHVNTGC